MPPSLRPAHLLLSTAVLLLLSFGAAAATPSSWLQPFSADFSHVEGKQTSSGKIFAIRTAVRIETQNKQAGASTITIVRLDRNENHTLTPAAKSNIEQPYAGAAGGRVAEFAPYVQGAAVQRKALGVEKIGQYNCDKYLLEVTYEGRTYYILEWAARELHGFAVRKEGAKGEWSTEYSNIHLGPQEPLLFEIPSDYKTMGFGDGDGMFAEAFFPEISRSQRD